MIVFKENKEDEAVPSAYARPRVWGKELIPSGLSRALLWGMWDIILN
jgi:hypothetical protein